MERAGPARISWRGARVRYTFPRLARVATALAVAFFWVPLLPFVIPLDLGPPSESLLERFTLDLGWFWLGGALLSAIVAQLASKGWSRAASVAVDSRCFYVEVGGREQRMARGAITSGIVHPGARPDVELELSSGRTLLVAMRSEEQAQELLGALGLGPQDRRVRIELSEPGRGLRRAGFAVLGSLLAVCIAMAFVPRHVLDLLSGRLVLVWFLMTVLVLRALRAPEITVGADGLVIRTPWRTRYVPFARVADIRVDGDWIVARLSSRKTVTVRGWSADRADLVVRRAREAMRGAPDGGREASTGWLERRGRSIANWRASVVAGLRPTGTYRSAAHAPDDALRVLGDSKAPTEQRIGAALALVGSGEPSAADRVRAAAEASANKKLRIALTAAAEEEADLAAIEAALAEDAGESGKRPRESA